MRSIQHNLSRLTRVVALGVALVLPLQGVAIGAGDARKVSGEVLAVNTYDTPNTIVLRSMTSARRELIVGATVGSAANIKRGNRTVGLGDIQVGERVRLTYVKTPDGLVARSIKVREGGIAP